MVFLLILLLSLAPPVFAKSMRTVRLAEGEMEAIYVQPGFSTLIKFDSHPEPGLIGDQDGFKVEYMRNLVAIKPLVSKGKTNLFIFTKEGQFNFQLVASRERHDNMVYVTPKRDNGYVSPGVKVAVPVDELVTRRLNKTVALGSCRLTLESVAIPGSRSTFVLKFLIQEKAVKEQDDYRLDQESLAVFQGGKAIKIENVFLETKRLRGRSFNTAGLILIRAADLKTGEPIRLRYSLKTSKQDLSVSFTPELGRR